MPSQGVWKLKNKEVVGFAMIFFLVLFIVVFPLLHAANIFLIFNRLNPHHLRSTDASFIELSLSL